MLTHLLEQLIVGFTTRCDFEHDPSGSFEGVS